MPPVRNAPLRPYWQTTDHRTVRLYKGNIEPTLAGLSAGSVQCVVTSPPYWGLRDYGTDKTLEIGSEPSPDCLAWARQEAGWPPCGGCYVCRLVGVFREVRRVLRDDGMVWLNMGDTYAQGSNLVGVPWRLALALQADGWILRQDIIWAKPSPMPESVRNRCTKAHEYVFLLAKRQGYYCDMEAIKERTASRADSRDYPDMLADASELNDQGERWQHAHSVSTPAGRNRRSVWRVSSHPYPGAHFATFPPKLIDPMIRAGTSERGCCAACGAPWRRVTEERALTRPRPNQYVKRDGAAGTGNSCANGVAGVEVRTLGWEAGCRCDPQQVLPCVVLDPFAGSGTTAAVCIGLGRSCWGVDLSEAYLLRNAIPRVVGVLTSRPGHAHLAGYDPGRVDAGEDLPEEGD